MYVYIAYVDGKQVEMNPRGNRYWGLCPFHRERTPSFSMDKKGEYLCFGCHRTGKVERWGKEERI